jgi:hypothetical protein
VREAAAAAGLSGPPVIVVDHGGPLRASAEVRDQRRRRGARLLLRAEVSRLAAASMESPDGPDFDFNRPLLADALLSPGFNSGDVVVAPSSSSPGRHAGPGGDLSRIAREAEARSHGCAAISPGSSGPIQLAIEHLASSSRGASHGALP